MGIEQRNESRAYIADQFFFSSILPPPYLNELPIIEPQNRALQQNIISLLNHAAEKSISIDHFARSFIRRTQHISRSNSAVISSASFKDTEVEIQASALVAFEEVECVLHMNLTSIVYPQGELEKVH